MKHEVLSKVVHAQSASLNDTLKRADWDRFAAVHRDDYLPTVHVAPFLMAALLTDLAKAMLSQDSNNFFAAANEKALTHSLPLMWASRLNHLMSLATPRLIHSRERHFQHFRASG